MRVPNLSDDRRINAGVIRKTSPLRNAMYDLLHYCFGSPALHRNAVRTNFEIIHSKLIALEIAPPNQPLHASPPPPSPLAATQGSNATTRAIARIRFST
jgi:hypothetical protein